MKRGELQISEKRNRCNLFLLFQKLYLTVIRNALNQQPALNFFPNGFGGSDGCKGGFN